MADSILIVETLRGELTIASPGTTGPRGLPGAAGPTAVSTDADNAATLGGDGLVFVPEPDAAPVDSVNTKTGAVVLDAADVGAAAADHAHAAADLSDSTPTGEAVVTAADAAAARTALGAGTSDFDGAYASLSGAPSLGTAAPLDVPASGDAAAGEVVKGDDARLTDDRTPTAHSHPVAVGDLTDVTTVGEAVATAADQAAARTAIGAGTGDGTSDFDGAYSSLSGTPTLGTAAALDVPATGDAAAGEVVKGDDTRLGGGGVTEVTDLDATGGTDGHVATVSGEAIVLAAPTGGGASALDDLTDVDLTTTTPTTDDVLTFDGTDWVPSAGTIATGGGAAGMSRTSDQTGSSATRALITWSAVDFATGCITPNTSGTFTVSESGVYVLGLTLMLGSNTLDARVYATVNTTDAPGDADMFYRHEQGAYMGFSATRALDLSAGDVVRLWFYGSTAWTLRGALRSRVWMHKTGSVGGASELDDLSDVDTSTVAPTDGQSLVWATDKWVPGDVAAADLAYSADLGAVTAATPVTITHNLGTLDVVVQVVEKDTAGAGAAAGTVVDATIDVADTNSINLTFTSSAAANLYRVTVLAGGGAGAAAVDELQVALLAQVYR